MPIFYFSNDEEGVTFFSNTQDLLNQDGVRNQDCYVYEGDTTEERIREGDDDYQELTAVDYLGDAVKTIEKLKAENKKLAEIDHQLYSVRRDADICEITGLEDISELEDFVAELKDASTGDEIEELKEENEKLKTENEKLKGGISNLNQVHQDEIVYVNAKCQKMAKELEEAMNELHNEDELETLQEGYDELKEEIEAYETMTGVKRNVIIAHADPTNDEHYTYKTCDEYEEELGEAEEPRCDFCNRTHDEVMYHDDEEDAWNGDTGCCKKCEEQASSK